MSECEMCLKPFVSTKRGQRVCEDCCPHDYAWGVCKHCGRTWGVEWKAGGNANEQENNRNQ